MRFMVIVKGCDGEKTPSQEFLATMGQYNEELKKSGVLLAMEVLQPAATGTRVKFTGKKPVVTDGPLFGDQTRVKYVFVDGVKYEPAPEAPAAEKEESR